jgi:hypothetical protein
LVDCILSFHTSAATCGTAKFNLKLARELGVPMYQVNTPAARQAKHPLLSLRHHECSLWSIKATWEAFDLFLHEWTEETDDWLQCHHPMRVFAGNAEIAAKVRPLRSDVIEAWCPATIEGNPHRGTINVLTFGMAHKIQTTHYQKLKALLDATGEDYTVSVSTAIHEGSPWDETAVAGDKLRAIFGDRLRVLGYLADDALVAEMARCTHIALFFDPALRANNTTYFAAENTAQVIVTNIDEYSPPRPDCVHDIQALDALPPRSQYVRIARHRPHQHSWASLATLLQEVPCAS